jgi:DNA replication protein DnaC
MESAETTCSACGGSGWILSDDDSGRHARECGCRREAMRRTRFAAARVPERYRDCSFRGFHELNPSLKKALKIAEEFADAYPYVENDAGLLFLGRSGVGKTHLAIAILNEVTRAKGRSGLYVDFSDLLMQIQSTFKSDSSESKEDVLAPYADVELLVLDELGATKPTDFARDMLYSLLNARYNHRRITIATSNFLDEPPPGEREKLEDRVGYRLRSRLHEMCRTVEMDGIDYRSNIGKAGLRPVKRAR